MSRILICALLLCACSPSGALDVAQCEGEDEMTCRIPQERFTMLASETSVTVPLFTIPNRNGSAMIAVGSADTVGAYRLQPRSSNFSSNVPLFVSAEAPFIGNIDGPIDVYSIVVSSFTPTFSGNPIVDLISFESLPPSAPKRAVMVLDGTQTLDGSGAAPGTMVANVRGRKRVRMSCASPAGHNFTAAMSAYAVGGQATTYLVLMDTSSQTGAAGYYIEFSLPALHSGSPHTPPGISVIDYVTFLVSAGTAADPILYSIQAWDE